MPRSDLLGTLGGGPKNPLPEIALEQCDQRMSALLATLSAEDRKLVAPQCRSGPRLTTLLECAAERGADLIVMGTSGATGISRYLLGSTANKTLRQASCPVLCVPSSEARRFEKDELF